MGAAAQPQAGAGPDMDVLASIRRMIAEDKQGIAAGAAPLHLDVPVLPLESSAFSAPASALPPLRLGSGASPDATRLRATALREAIRARAAEPAIPPAEPARIATAAPAPAPAVDAPLAVPPAVAATDLPVATPVAVPVEGASAPEPTPSVAAAEVPVAEVPAIGAQGPAIAAPPMPAATDAPADSFFGEMIREVLRQELRGDSLERMSCDLRAMVLREVARAITGDPGR